MMLSSYRRQTLTRAKRLRGNGRFICREAFSRRKGYFTAKEGGLLRQEDLPGQANPMANPDKMMGPMKSQVRSLSSCTISP